ncbi:MAG TPA: hypothetical protein VH083_21570 [Myxococcales bacterium]|jgi:hypothetical protein|nr:hypothetical protein [Myxococcales bacterium]
MVRSFRLVAALGLSSALGCASARTSSTPREKPLSSDVEAPGQLFRVLYQPADAAEARRLRKELLAVAPKLSRWGKFRQGIAIHVQPDHAAFEEAVRRRGYPWLHAWAFEDQIELESPRELEEAQLQELLTHELTHSLMLQLMARKDEWSADNPPLWFREGMASVTAGQGYRRMSASDLRRWSFAHPDANLLEPEPELYRTEREAVYAAAHLAFERLLVLIGDEGVRAILWRMREGDDFPQAFTRATGRDLRDFEHNALSPPQLTRKSP